MPGFQTFGDDYVVDKPEMEITVKLKRPAEQYSIYTDKNNDVKGETCDCGNQERRNQTNQGQAPVSLKSWITYSRPNLLCIPSAICSGTRALSGTEFQIQ